MPPHLSLYLDAVRFGAALIVFVGHFSAKRLSGGLLYQIEWFGTAAVDIFFVLSGFVIAEVTAGRAGSATGYAAGRAARVLSVVVPALLLTALLDTLGRTLNPEFYRHVPHFDPDRPFAGFPGSLLFINQIWLRADQPGSNVPYWSMGFEVWYYAIFGVACFASGRLRWLGCAALLLLAGPKIAALFPIWLAGVVAARACRGTAPPRPLVWAMAAAPLVLIFARGWLVGRWEPYIRLNLDDPLLPHAWWNHLIGLVFALHIVGVRFLAPLLPLPMPLRHAIRWCAGCTFGLYLFHYPMLHFAAAMMDAPPDSVPRHLVLGVVVPILAILLARAVEPSKAVWRRGIEHLLTPRRPA